MRKPSPRQADVPLAVRGPAPGGRGRRGGARRRRRLFVRLVKAGDDAPPIRLAPGKDEAAAGAPGPRRPAAGALRDAGGRRDRGAADQARWAGAAAILGVVRKSRRRGAHRAGRPPVQGHPDPRRRTRAAASATATSCWPRSIGAGERAYGPKRGKLLEVVGREDEPRAASLIAIHTHGIPTGFSAEAEAEAEAARPPTLAGRDDLRDLPLITIDPADARDHDDAVSPTPDDDPNNPGGWIVLGRHRRRRRLRPPGSALDRDAREKANSVYFPDRVEPMLPERLSAGLCSLVQGENRACLAVRMVFDARGRKLGHKFVRGLMRSAAKLSYEQAQAAIDGLPDDATGPLLEPILKPLWAAYAVLRDRPRRALAAGDRVAPSAGSCSARTARWTSITPRASLEAHKLIEEMMIQANVCAAETLEQRRAAADLPHPRRAQRGEDPGPGRLPRHPRHPLDQGRGAAHRPLQPPAGRRPAEAPHAEIVNEVVLRTQMQAIYSPGQHRPLRPEPRPLRPLHLADPPLRRPDRPPRADRGAEARRRRADRGAGRPLKSTAEHITMAERRAMAAERDATDRYVAAFLTDRVGAEFEGRITGVTRFGLFVRLAETGADGLVPVSSLGGGILRPRRQRPRPGRRALRRALAAGTAGRGAAEGGDAAHRRPAVRDAERSRAARSERPAAAGWASSAGRVRRRSGAAAR